MGTFGNRLLCLIHDKLGKRFDPFRALSSRIDVVRFDDLRAHAVDKVVV